MATELTLQQVELMERHAEACDRIRTFQSEFDDDYLDKLLACGHACDTIVRSSFTEMDMNQIHECAASILTIENARWDEEFYEKAMRCADAIEVIANAGSLP